MVKVFSPAVMVTLLVITAGSSEASLDSASDRLRPPMSMPSTVVPFLTSEPAEAYAAT